MSVSFFLENVNTIVCLQSIHLVNLNLLPILKVNSINIYLLIIDEDNHCSLHCCTDSALPQQVRTVGRSEGAVAISYVGNR
jgi:hypothetical protein